MCVWCVCLYIRLCVNTHQSQCVVSPGKPTWAFAANTGLIAQTRVHMRAVCKDAVCLIFSLTYRCAASCKDSLQCCQKKVPVGGVKPAFLNFLYLSLFSHLSPQERKSPSSRRLRNSLPGRRERSRQPQEQTQDSKPANRATMSAKHPKITHSLDQRRIRALGKIRHAHCIYYMYKNTQ